MELAIECHDLVKIYLGRPPVEAVRGLDVEVQVVMFRVLGPNGREKPQPSRFLKATDTDVRKCPGSGARFGKPRLTKFENESGFPSENAFRQAYR